MTVVSGEYAFSNAINALLMATHRHKFQPKILVRYRSSNIKSVKSLQNNMLNKVKSSIIITVRVNIYGLTKLSISRCDRLKFANRIFLTETLIQCFLYRDC